MKKSLGMPALLLFMLLASCNENQPASTTDSRTDASRITSAAAKPVDPKSSSADRPAAHTPVVAHQAPAQSAQWTLYCQTVRGAGHVQEASRLKAQLMNNPQLKDWYLVHNEDDSVICYGYYNQINDAKAKSDKKRIESLIGANGETLFASVVFQPIGSPDPESPPQWNLANVPENRYWSLQIAAFRGFPERKRYAVEAVREARAQGVEAYYFHGATISSVCIGAWPVEAVKRQGEQNVARSDNPDTPLVVLNDVIPPYLTPSHTDKNGKPIVVVAPKLDVIDSTLAAAIKKFPEHAVNGYVNVIKDENGAEVPTASFLVQIPHRLGPGQDPFENNRDQVGPSDPDAVRAEHNLNLDDAPGLGKLRTLGEH